MTEEQLKLHVDSFAPKTQLPLAKLKSKCQAVLTGLRKHENGHVFFKPVDPVKFGLTDYFDIIKVPMDFSTVKRHLQGGCYHSIEDFQADVNLIFDNAMTYHKEGSNVYDMAKELKTRFSNDMKKMMAQLEVENQQRCVLCGDEQLQLKRTGHYCSGCQSHIRRSVFMYVDESNQYCWCKECHEKLEKQFDHVDMKRTKNDGKHFERFVQCISCKRRVHQACGLFNPQQSKDHHSDYCCPLCLFTKRQIDTTPSTKPLAAAALPRTNLSQWLEKSVAKKVEQRNQELAQEMAQNKVRTVVLSIVFYFILLTWWPCFQNISFEEALKQLNREGPIIIRQVTAMDDKHEVRELMRKRYKNFPNEFPYRSKCIVVFQELDGVDVILFALYVYEHDENNPPPNQRVVSIAYLDSVNLMRPRKLRTIVYKEILIAYLDYARRRGFATAHIWSCPPGKGDDYIFYAKPKDQQTLPATELRKWYIDMLTECQKRNIVGNVTNMQDLYFANEDLDATAVPYLHGDYFPDKVENIIKTLEEDRVEMGSGGTKSTGEDEEAHLASGTLNGDKRLKKKTDRDQVMLKLGEAVKKENVDLIVAFLNWSGAKEEDMIVSDEIEQARREFAAKNHDDDVTGSKSDLGRNLCAATSIGDDGSPVKIIDDDVEDISCELLNNRQKFLDFCITNDLQFDDCRRAKQTSLLLLWHLHNPDAPQLSQQCTACNINK